jgi:hypothetical protein
MMKAEKVTKRYARALNIIVLISLLFVYGCGSTGKNFNESLYKNIIAGTTTHKEIQAMFGPPFKKGVQNGSKVWTYEYNAYNSLGKDITKDMVIVFTPNGVVKSHQMMNNQP